MENINQEFVKEAAEGEVSGVQNAGVSDKSYVQETKVVVQPSPDEPDFFEKEEMLRNAAQKEAKSLQSKSIQSFGADLIENMEDYDKSVSIMLNDFEIQLRLVNSKGRNISINKAKPSLTKMRDFFSSYVMRIDKILFD